MTRRTRRPGRRAPRGLAEALAALLALAGVQTYHSACRAQSAPGLPPPGASSAPAQPLPPPATAEPPRVVPPGGQSPAAAGPVSGGGSVSSGFPGPAPTPPPPAITPPPPPPPGLTGTPIGTGALSPQFEFKIDPKTPVKKLLPAAPKATGQGGPLLSDDLTRVPEVSFEAAPAKGLPGIERLKHNAHTLAKVNHLNARKRDGFLEALLDDRPDLAGLPVAMGDACRMKGERSREFNKAVATVRSALQRGVAIPPPNIPAGATSVSVTKIGQGFWPRYESACLNEDTADPNQEPRHREHVTRARIAALTQMLAPESTALRKGLVKYLAGISHREATRALAKLAIFSAEDEVRSAAVEALKVRRERDYTDILLAGLRYPWPTVARRAGDALVKLERDDLIEKLVDLLDEPDPRLPVTKTVRKKSVPVVRELVRINHHRNCVLCHAPGNTGNLSADVGTAPVPTPGESLSPPSTGYGSSSHNVLVRIDVTYLRQDFSVLQPVADAHPWPEMQRFDFLMRTRVLTEEEAKVFRDKLTPREKGRMSPYQRAILSTLRELTGRDTAPTSQAWRELLGLPARQQKEDKGTSAPEVIRG
jgi:hypothetical protein